MPSSRACPMPWAIPPWTCPAASRGFIIRPASCTATYFSTRMAPVSWQTSTTATWVAKAYGLVPSAWLRLKSSPRATPGGSRAEEHTSELQSRGQLVCRLLLEKKKLEKTSIRKQETSQEEK